MAELHIHEVHTDMEITESVGSLSPAEIKKLVSLVMTQIKEQQHREDLRCRDNRLQNSAYVSDLTD